MKRFLLPLAFLISAMACHAQGLTGTWTWGKETASGGTLKIIDHQGHLSFQLTCYRMRSSQFVGDLSGSVAIEKNRGEFVSPDLPECRILFTVKPTGIKLVQTGKGDCEFGTGVQADGLYKRISNKKPTLE
jgi:hypothetical protein